MIGFSRIRIGWHAICAATGNATISARGAGIKRESFFVSGSAKRRIPPVAMTDSAKAKSNLFVYIHRAVV